MLLMKAIEKLHLKSPADENFQSSNATSREVQIDKLYKLLDGKVRYVLEKITKLEIPLNDQDSLRNGLVRFDTSLISIFLNRCHLSFKQMMFENLSDLKNSLEIYLSNEN